MSETPSESKGTEYLVLERRGVSGPEEAGEKQTNSYWVERQKVTARSARDAVASYVKSDSNRGGVFVAVPVRSWGQIEVSTETQTKLVFS